MKTTVTQAWWAIDRDGAWVSFLAPSPAEARAMCETLQPDKPYTVEVKRHYERRSKNANDLLWELCMQLSEKLSHDKLIVSKEEIYRRHIKIAGKCDFVACIERAAEALMDGWSQKGIGWFAEMVDDCKIDGCVKICLYYGSSTYNTAEMSRLLDSVIQECEQCGVEVLSSAELSLIKEEWR